MTIAQNNGLSAPCRQALGMKNGKCDLAECRAECTRRRNGDGYCILGPNPYCRCGYQLNKRNSCLP